MEINYRHVLPIIVVKRTTLFYYCIAQDVPQRMHRFISVTKTLLPSAPQKGVTWCEVRISWRPGIETLVLVTAARPIQHCGYSDDLGSFELHGANVEEFEYHHDIARIWWPQRRLIL